MQKFSLKEMERGWFIGDFFPSALRTKDFEVGLVKHKKGDTWDKHYHEEITEISLFLKGKVKVNNEIFSTGDILVINPYETVDPLFLEDTEVIIIKTPSIIGDKKTIKR
jgi:hypothetical protein